MLLIKKSIVLAQKENELSTLNKMLNNLEVNDSNKQRIEQLKISISLHKEIIKKLEN